MPAVAHIRLLPDADDPARRLAELGPISPELALVDPELARAARALLPDPPSLPARSAPVSRALEAVEQPAEERSAEIASPSGVPAQKFVLRHFAAGVVAGLLIAALAAEAYLWLGSVRPESPVGPESSAPGLSVPNGPTAGGAPPAASPPSTATVLGWPPAPGAAAYDVTLWRDGNRVFERVVWDTRLPLPLHWQYAGRQRRLEPGAYRWVVRPLRRSGARLRSGAPIIDATYVVPERASPSARGPGATAR